MPTSLEVRALAEHRHQWRRRALWLGIAVYELMAASHLYRGGLDEMLHRTDFYAGIIIGLSLLAFYRRWSDLGTLGLSLTAVAENWISVATSPLASAYVSHTASALIVVGLSVVVGPRVAVLCALILAVALPAGIVWNASMQGGPIAWNLVLISDLVLLGSAALMHVLHSSFAEILQLATRHNLRAAELLNDSPDGVLAIDPTDHVEMANPAACRLLGRPSDALLGTSVDSLPVAPRVGAVETASAADTQIRLCDVVDRDCVLEVVTRRWTREDGTQGTMLLLRDVTERRKAELEVRRLKSYLANVIDSMPSVLVGMDQEENVTQWNRQAEVSTGVSTTAALGKPVGRVLPDFFPSIEAMRDEVQHGRPASKEKVLLVKEGERHLFDVIVYPLVAEGSQGAVARIDDVTERTRLEEMMVQTEKMMSVGGLAAGMAHEINNPLGIISQAAQNLERRVSAELPANREAAAELGVDLALLNRYLDERNIFLYVKDIREAAARAARIVENVLQFSRRSGADLLPALLADLLDRAVELAASDYDLKKKFDFRAIEIVREYEPDLPAVPVIAVEFEQVVLNLLKNAAQAMAANPSERKPRITLRLRRDGRYATAEVEDNGPGMEEHVRRRVFEPFFTTKEPGVGTGLGLSVSHKIVTQNHHGLIAVESSPGNGARFTVKLPVVPGEWS
jgi:PAS domain S-box-containing protein